MANSDDLLDYIFDGRNTALYAEFDGWVRESRRFRVFATDYRAGGGSQAGKVWLALPRHQAPTAVVLGNDLMAMAFMRELLQAGVSIPRDVSVVGFDGLPEAGLCWPGLTTASQPAGQMGTDAAVALLSQLDDPKSSTSSTRHYPMHLVVRESTGAAPAR